jgi:hypothetical protein
MISKPLHDIGIDDVKALVGRVRESKTLELKASLPPGKDGALKVLAGVSALANTLGGDFIIGVSETDGVAKAVDGIEPEGGVDTYKRTLQQILADRLEPHLPTLDLHQVECAPGRWVFIIRVARSWIGPHRVTSNNHFYLRTSSLTVPMDVGDVRTAFSQRETGLERIEAFRRDRLLQLSAGRTPVRLTRGPIAILHMAPLPAFVNRDVIDIATAVACGSHMPVPLEGRGRDALANLLGICNTPGDGGDGATGYGQLFRSGAYEGTNVAHIVDGTPYVASIGFANMVVGAVRSYLALQDHYSFAFPTFAMLSFCNAAGLKMTLPTELGSGFYLPQPLVDDIVALPEIVIDNARVDVPKIVRPLLNFAWNAFGQPQCTMYDGQGVWMGL